MIAAVALCAALHADASLTAAEVARGCRLAPAVVEAAKARRQDPTVLLAISWREARFDVAKLNGTHCGAWQVRSWIRAGKPWGLTCAELQQAQPAAVAAADLLTYFGRRSRGVAATLQRYAGCRAGCSWYSDQILDKAAQWRRAQDLRSRRRI